MRPLRIISGKEIDRGILPYPKSPIAEKIWEIISEKHEFAPLSQESLVNLGIANELLKKEAIIVYLNHSSEDDASVAIALALSHLTNAVRFMGPAGMKHYDLKRDKKNGILLRSLRLLNIHVIPVVQHDDLDNYSESKRNRMLKRLKKKSKSLLSKKGGIYGISPEGTRNQEDFKLLPARPGIGKVGKYAPKNICYLPIAIVYKNQSDKP